MANRFWVGGTGSWSSTSHWSATSAGSSGASVPLSTDSVIFDAGSGGAGYIVTLGTETVADFTLSSAFPTGYFGNFGSDIILFNGTSLTVTGTFSMNGSTFGPGSLLSIASSDLGTPFTISAATVSISRCLFKDITATGAGTWSGTRIGDKGGNSGITFDAPRTVYLINSSNHTWWDASTWSNSSGGAAGAEQPFPQDTVIIDNNSGPSTYTFGDYLGGFLDFSARSTDFLFSNAGAGGKIYSGIKLSSHAVGPGTMVMVGSGAMTIEMNGAIPNGFTIQGFPVIINGTGTVTMVDEPDFGIGSITLTQGTFDPNNFDVTIAQFISSSTARDRVLNMGSGTWTLNTVSTSAAQWIISDPTNFTLNKDTSTIQFINTGSSTFFPHNNTFIGAGLSYGPVIFGNGATEQYLTTTINDSNTFESLQFANILSTYVLESGETQTVTGLYTQNFVSNLQASTLHSEAFLSAAIAHTDYIEVRDIHALGAAIDFIDWNGHDLGGNTNWDFFPPDLEIDGGDDVTVVDDQSGEWIELGTGDLIQELEILPATYRLSLDAVFTSPGSFRVFFDDEQILDTGFQSGGYSVEYQFTTTETRNSIRFHPRSGTVMTLDNVRLRARTQEPTDDDRPVGEFLTGTTDYGREIIFRADTQTMQIQADPEMYSSVMAVITETERGSQLKTYISLDDQPFFQVEGTNKKGVSMLKTNNDGDDKVKPPLAQSIQVSLRDSSKQLCRVVQMAVLTLPTPDDYTP